ncbi:unnamed protein product [Lupinus luteus]|uniref:C2 domain-containing protein n=1 Tax=Lupinus luteus TaxID=3873 RepID=A0AAV1XH76_LUPLU
MDYRCFNINLIQAFDFNTTEVQFFKKPIYAMVSIVGSSSSKHRTSVAKYKGNKHTWGTSSTMKFHMEDTKLQQNDLVLMIQIVHKRMLVGDKVIGEVCVPLKELYDNSSGINNDTNYITLQVVNSSGSFEEGHY